jgi:cell division protease FtsH
MTNSKPEANGAGNAPRRFPIGFILLGLVVLLFIQLFFLTTIPRQEISYSEFQRLLEANEIVEVVISPTTIEGHLHAQGREGENLLFKTIRVDDPNLITDLKEKNIPYAGKLETTWLRDMLIWFLPFLLIIGIWIYVLRRMARGPTEMMTVGRSKARVYMEKEIHVTFADVAGVDEAIEELREVVDFLQTPEKFAKLGGHIPRGILLVGPPGTGKTLLGRAVAGEAGVPFFSIIGSEFIEMFVGVGAARVRDLFNQAKEKAPCIIFIDELDAMGKARGITPAFGGHDEREHTLNQLLAELDGFDPRVGVILMAATNRPEILDPALLRPGRFDRQVLVDRPDMKGREAILKIHAKVVKLAPDVDLGAVAKMTTGFVGADLANLVNEAALLAVRGGKETVEMADFQEAVERIVAGLEKKSRVLNKLEKDIVAHHEVGHALVALSLPGTDRVHKISIVPRGIAALGYTMQLPTEDRFLMTRAELLNKIAVLLGGTIAEELIFNEISTGAQNDLHRATDIARTMVTEYGMTKKLGHMTFRPAPRPMYLPEGMPQPQGEYSEETAKAIDGEVHNIVEGQYERVKKLLEEKKEVLQKGAQLVLEREVISGEDLRALMEEPSSLNE